MIGRFMGTPRRLVDVELEDEELRFVGRRAIGKEELNPWLRHRWCSHDTQYLGKRFGFTFFRLEHDCDDEALIQCRQRGLRNPVRQQGYLHWRWLQIAMRLAEAGATMFWPRPKCVAQGVNGYQRNV